MKDKITPEIYEADGYTFKSISEVKKYLLTTGKHIDTYHSVRGKKQTVITLNLKSN